MGGAPCRVNTVAPAWSLGLERAPLEPPKPLPWYYRLDPMLLLLVLISIGGIFGAVVYVTAAIQ